MRALNILNLKPGKLNYHDEVYSQGRNLEAARCQPGLEDAGITAVVDGLPAGSAVQLHVKQVPNLNPD